MKKIHTKGAYNSKIPQKGNLMTNNTFNHIRNENIPQRQILSETKNNSLIGGSIWESPIPKIKYSTSPLYEDQSTILSNNKCIYIYIYIYRLYKFRRG